jgi:hypothetical protein
MSRQAIVQIIGLHADAAESEIVSASFASQTEN